MQTRTLSHFHVQRYSITNITHIVVKNRLTHALIYLRGGEVGPGGEDGPGDVNGPGGEDGLGDKVCLGNKGGPGGEVGSGGDGSGDDGSKGEGGGPRGEVGGDVIYGGSSILGINVNKGVIYLVSLLSFCRE